jgi:4,5-dihydroxyphthalate decarboxylase
LAEQALAATDTCLVRGKEMAALAIRLTCADYARVMPLALGSVKPDGIDLTMVLGRAGSWPMRAELLRRATSDPTVDGGESSMAGHLRRIDEGDRSLVALPVFLLRNFTARDLYVRNDGEVKTPADLAGRRIGMYDWVASGSIWYRHLLRFIGVPPEQLQWWIGDVDEPRITSHLYSLPDYVRAAPTGHALSEMLIGGELDAMFSPPRPRRYHPQDGPIGRLFPAIRTIEREYFRVTRIFPPQHLVVLRRDVWLRNKWIARALTEAFVQCTAVFAQAQRSFPYASPWFEAELEETEALMGPDYHADGFERNREAIEVFAEQAYLAGIVKRRIGAEEYFAEFLEG